MTFDNIKVGDTVGKNGFPYNFLTVIQKEPDLIVVEKNIGNQIMRGVVVREAFDQHLLSVYDIQDGEIVKENTPQLPAHLPQPTL